MLRMSLPSSSWITLASACGSSRSTPVCSIGAVTMNTMRSTSNTSSMGVTLISLLRRRGPPVFMPIDRLLLEEVPAHDVEEVLGELLHLRLQHGDLADEV